MHVHRPLSPMIKLGVRHPTKKERKKERMYRRKDIIIQVCDVTYTHIGHSTYTYTYTQLYQLHTSTSRIRIYVNIFHGVATNSRLLQSIGFFAEYGLFNRALLYQLHTSTSRITRLCKYIL